jgi:hypothetical protein
MIVLTLPDELHQYLTEHIFRRHIASGLQPEELIACTEIWKRLASAQSVDFSKLGEGVASITPDGLKLDIEPKIPV